MPFDRDMQKAVQAELDWEPTVNTAHIGVTAADGIVTLTGHVGSLDQKHAVELAVGRIRGVRGIVEDIVVIAPSTTRIDDEEIAQAAVEKLDWNAALTMRKIRVKVENGRITLTGRIGSDQERQAASSQVRYLPGVTGVLNQILIEPLVNGDNVRTDIMQALQRFRLDDQDEIAVEIDGGEVRLTGRVANLEEWIMAAAIAHAARGATMVKNDILIGMPSPTAAE